MTLTSKILAEIKKAGYKLTPQRRAVIDALCRTTVPATPGDIHASLLSQHPDIGLVTVYRTLELLQQLGLLCRFNDGTAVSFKAGPAEHHHHLVCRGSGDVVKISGHCPLELESLLEKETGFQITGHQLEFSGICRTCREEKDV